MRRNGVTSGRPGQAALRSVESPGCKVGLCYRWLQRGGDSDRRGAEEEQGLAGGIVDIHRIGPNTNWLPLRGRGRGRVRTRSGIQQGCRRQARSMRRHLRVGQMGFFLHVFRRRVIIL